MLGKAETSRITTFPKSKKASENHIVWDQIPVRKKSPEFLIDGSGSGDKNLRRRCFSDDEFSFD